MYAEVHFRHVLVDLVAENLFPNDFVLFRGHDHGQIHVPRHGLIRYGLNRHGHDRHCDRFVNCEQVLGRLNLARYHFCCDCFGRVHGLWVRRVWNVGFVRLFDRHPTRHHPSFFCEFADRARWLGNHHAVNRPTLQSRTQQTHHRRPRHQRLRRKCLRRYRLVQSFGQVALILDVTILNLNRNQSLLNWLILNDPLLFRPHVLLVLAQPFWQVTSNRSNRLHHRCRRWMTWTKTWKAKRLSLLAIRWDQSQRNLCLLRPQNRQPVLAWIRQSIRTWQPVQIWQPVRIWQSV